MFTSPRWNDTSLPKVTGYRELTEEEKREIAIENKRILVEYGVIKESDDFNEKFKEVDFDNLDEYVKNSMV
ncbi:MAG: hypothetical protein LIO62_02925 [Clostridiales bacterium]|nr:hypothetical protein [Clostridiales bacterium]